MGIDLDVAVRVAVALDAAGVEYVLGGSMASSLLGEPRSTNDVDFAVRLREEQIPALIACLGTDFAVDEEAIRAAVRLRRSENVFYLPTFFKVDLFVRGGAAFDESEFARRQRMLFADGRALYVASPEDSILRKLLWFRAGDEVSERQWRDILGMLRIQAGALDSAYLTEWARILGVEDLLLRAQEQARK